ncbi:hypothetical protein ACIOWG_17600 [Streptomyces sp. NPDC087658]|uniref:hypothetical protein n=2 Tax=unclassified Streptomyces TaxID=2593676 RepID=UPI00382E4269
MTSTTDTAQHPDVEEISDLTEGLLSPARTTAVRHHLDGCALCSDVHGSLEEIRGLLGTLPGPSRMPSDVAERIDAALAAEALLNATAPDEAAHVSRETTVPAPTTAEPFTPPLAPHPAESARTDAMVRADRPAGRPKAATGPGRGGRTRRRRIAVLGAVFGTAAMGVSVFFLLQTLRGTEDTATSSRAVSSAGSDSDEEFSGSPLKGRVDVLLASGSSAQADKESKTDLRSGTARTEAPVNSPMLRSTPEIPDCIRQGLGRTEPALAAEKGVYKGSAAYLVVLPHSGDRTLVQAYVIDATCVENASSARGKVLLTHSYPRG